MGAIRVTVNLPAATVEKIRAKADTKGETMTAVLSRLLADAVFLHEEVEKGNKVLTSDGMTHREVLLR